MVDLGFIGSCMVHKGESLLASTPLVVLSTFLGRVPTIEEYKASVAGIKLTSYAPPLKELTEN